jgi:hypothetical protein
MTFAIGFYEPESESGEPEKPSDDSASGASSPAQSPEDTHPRV